LEGSEGSPVLSNKFSVFSSRDGEEKGKGFATEVAEGPQRERRRRGKDEEYSPQRTQTTQRKQRREKEIQKEHTGGDKYGKNLGEELATFEAEVFVFD